MKWLRKAADIGDDFGESISCMKLAYAVAGSDILNPTPQTLIPNP
jgi:hypothetical protein